MHYLTGSGARFVRQKRWKKIPSNFHLLLNKRWHLLLPFLSNEPGRGYFAQYWNLIN
jgi:hypothetical protein